MIKYFLVLALFWATSLSAQNGKYSLQMHPEFEQAELNIPIGYLDKIDNKQYMLFWSKTDGFNYLVELSENFVPSKRRTVVTGIKNGAPENIFNYQIEENRVLLFTRSVDTNKNSQHFFVKTIDLNTLKVSNTLEVASGFYSTIPGPLELPSISFYGVTEPDEKDGNIELYYTERISNKSTNYHVVSFDNNANITNRYSIEIPQSFVQTSAGLTPFRTPKHYGNDVYSVKRFYQNDKIGFTVQKNTDMSVEKEITIDLGKNIFLGGHWSIDSKKLRIIGITGTNFDYGKVTGFINYQFENGKADFLDTILLDDEFLSKYEYSRKSSKSNLFGFYDRTIHFENGSQLVFAKLYFKDLFFAKVDSSGDFSWANQITATNIKPINKALSSDFPLWSGLDIIHPLGKNCLLIRNSHMNEFDQIVEFKNPKKRSEKFSINLYEIDPEGKIYNQILTNFERQTRYIIHPDYYWDIGNNELLLFSINAEEKNKYKFMTVTNEKER